MSDDEGRSSNEKAEEHLRGVLLAIRDLEKPGTARIESSMAEATGKNILHEELGYFGKWDGAAYTLDDQTRIRLLAHARQDIAATRVMLLPILEAVKECQRTIRLAVGISIISVAIGLCVLWLVWP